MRCCYLCKKKVYPGCGNLFRVPRDEITRAKWSDICGKELIATAHICTDHFLPSSIVRCRRKVLLLANAEPCVKMQDGTSVMGNNAMPPQKINSHNKVVMPPQLQEEPIMQIPIIKQVFGTSSTQTNTRFCGLVQASDFADEFRINCFYCPKAFPLEKWKKFINHLNSQHFELEEAFRVAQYISEDHDYTAINKPPSIEKSTTEEKINTIAGSLLPTLEDPLEPIHFKFKSASLNPSFYYPSDERTIGPEIGNKFVRKVNNQSWKMAKRQKLKSSKLSLKRGLKRKQSKETALSHCLKRTNDVEKVVKIERDSETETEICHDMDEDTKEEEYETISMEISPVMPTEIAFEYSPREIVDVLLDNMKNHPVLWHFDKEPFNEGFYDACENLCKIINEKWSMNIDNLKMRRSVSRILRFYCSNMNVKNVEKFSDYYNKCADFLPSSVNEIAYGRCSHCYICYSNDFDLKSHLLKEFSYLQWPYKCSKCNECFRGSDEYVFHRRLPHYDEIFRCEPCNMNFFSRNLYTTHIVDHHANDGKYKCDSCHRSFQSISGLKYHEINHGERQHKCDMCPKRFFHKRDLTIHFKIHQNQYDCMCEVCGKAFRTQGQLTTHMNMHTGAKITCTICNLKLRKSSLSRHLQLVHVPRIGGKLTRKKNYVRSYKGLIRSRERRRRWLATRNYSCKICKIAFETHKAIIQHNKEYHSDKPKWGCKMCSTEFTQKLNLQRHYRMKHDLHVIQVYKLLTENEDLESVLAFKIEDANILQMDVDNESRSWTCKICNSEFKQKFNLKRHYCRKHKLFMYQAFRLLDNDEDLDKVLGCKMEDDIDEGNLSETKIDKTSEQPEKLTTTLNTETILTNELPSISSPKWPCKMCSTKFTRKINLKYHYRDKHSLHAIQIIKLVDENKELNAVLALKTEDFSTMYENEKPYKVEETSSNKTPVKSNLLSDEICLEGEENICNSEIQDAIMKYSDNITQDIKIEYMNDFFTELLQEP